MVDKKAPKKKFNRKTAGVSQSEFEHQVLDIARVTRVMAGGTRMRFRACVVVGDRKGRIGLGLTKGQDVSLAIQKSVRQAEKNIVKINLVDGTISHEIRVKYRAAKVLLKPAPEGTGIISGGVVRTILELAGIKNAVSKILGSNNKVNNARAVFKALTSLRSVKEDARRASQKNDEKSAAEQESGQELKEDSAEKKEKSSE